MRYNKKYKIARKVVEKKESKISGSKKSEVERKVNFINLLRLE